MENESQWKVQHLPSYRIKIKGQNRLKLEQLKAL